MKKIYILILLFMMTINIYPNISDNTYTDKYLLLTFNGTIDNSPITMHIKIKNPDSIIEGKISTIKGHYKYVSNNNAIQLEGSIDKKGMTIKTPNNEIFAFTFNENQLYDIINSKNEIYVNLNGKWRNNDKSSGCSIKTIKFIHCLYEIYIEKEYKENTGSIGAIYIEDKSLAIYKGELTNTALNELISDMNDNLDKSLQTYNDDNLNNTQFVSISDYFDNNIFSIINYYDVYYLENDMIYKSSVSIFDIDSLVKINNYLGNLVYDTEKFRTFLKNKIKEQNPNYENDNFREYFDEYITSLNYAEIYFNTDASITIHFFFTREKMEYSFININIEELKPYIKPDSFYKYLFSN
ncbi:hypothetical protein BHAMNSH16_03865 [Brachyspira hampsonii]|uniref:Uncharacterized protein n=2 Tax=Brachyspira hampsonii TaxID=1287055 RepID=A0AAC9TSS1_9SPIR|nr:hypothetical protein [Brachyspira hampsonii]ASJ20828.1 hypothetical protein BHAMNSH16_03865 [Brachyspira hampsonii]MBW5380262.1 hypothetical protein [Brachyspira hampsonii]OEJ18973.1 hypothetical protein A9496_06090 [Brachyspira hampsonii]